MNSLFLTSFIRAWLYARLSRDVVFICPPFFKKVYPAGWMSNHVVKNPLFDAKTYSWRVDMTGFFVHLTEPLSIPTYTHILTLFLIISTVFQEEAMNDGELKFLALSALSW